MDEKRQRRSLRLRDYDYAQAGVYFITICTHKCALFFGDVVDDVMDTGALWSWRTSARALRFGAPRSSSL